MATEDCGSGGGGGTITGDHPALQNPTTPTELANFLESTNRPEFNSPGLAAELYVGDWSGDGGGTASDTTGTGHLVPPHSR